jgi:hypothetical protein
VGSDEPVRRAEMAENLDFAAAVPRVELGIAEMVRIGLIPIQIFCNQLLQVGVIWQSNSKGQLPAKADRLDPDAPIFIVSDSASLKLGVGGFVDDRRSDPFHARCGICEKSLVEHAASSV